MLLLSIFSKIQRPTRTVCVCFFLAAFLCLAQHAKGQGNTLQKGLHHHSPFDILSGSGTDSIVCYKKAHRDIYLGMSLLVLFSAGLSMYGYRVKRRSNRELKLKNKIIEEKNRDILGSIEYARRLQQAILPSSETITKLFPESFVLYAPKDIVSGDLYWVSEQKGKALIAAVDCTGHGVPGALLSIVGNNMLNKAIDEKGLFHPNDILDSLNKDVVETLRQGNKTDINDGMDIALCSFDHSSYILEFAGGFNSLFYFSSGELKEVKADRFSVNADTLDQNKKFTLNRITLDKGDRFYIFTDGSADQFGGANNKKLKISQLKELLRISSHEPIEKQKNLLWQKINEWKGDNDQTDDILIIGVGV